MKVPFDKKLIDLHCHVNGECLPILEFLNKVLPKGVSIEDVVLTSSYIPLEQGQEYRGTYSLGIGYLISKKEHDDKVRANGLFTLHSEWRQRDSMNVRTSVAAIRLLHAAKLLLAGLNVRELVSREDRARGLALETSEFGLTLKDLEDEDFREHSRWYGAFDGTVLVGVTHINVKPLKAWEESKATYNQLLEMNPEISIEHTVVAPSYRKRGVARSLRAHLQSVYASIITGIGESSNKAAMERLNAEQGFVKFWESGPNAQYFWKR